MPKKEKLIWNDSISFIIWFQVWKTKQSNGSTCPICRKEIIMTSTNQALDACIERFIDNFYPEAAKVTRTELVSERTAKKEARIANQGKKENKPAGHHRHRILLRPGNFRWETYVYVFDSDLPSMMK